MFLRDCVYNILLGLPTPEQKSQISSELKSKILSNQPENINWFDIKEIVKTNTYLSQKNVAWFIQENLISVLHDANIMHLEVKTDGLQWLLSEDVVALTQIVKGSSITDLTFENVKFKNTSFYEVTKLLDAVKQSQLVNLNLQKTFYDPHIDLEKISHEMISRFLDDGSSKAYYADKYKGIYADALASELAFCMADSNLDTIDLSGNFISDHAMIYICAGLWFSDVSQINLSANRISDFGLDCFSEILENTSFNSINFAANEITDKGVKYLSDALAGQSVDFLDLSFNAITDEGAQYLAQGLKDATVRVLNLSGNQITTDGAQILETSLKGTGVKLIYLDSKSIMFEEKIFDDATDGSLLPYSKPSSYISSNAEQEKPAMQLKIDDVIEHSEESAAVGGVLVMNKGLQDITQSAAIGPQIESHNPVLPQIVQEVELINFGV